MKNKRPPWWRFKAREAWDWDEELEMIKKRVDANFDKRERTMKHKTFLDERL